MSERSTFQEQQTPIQSEEPLPQGCYTHDRYPILAGQTVCTSPTPRGPELGASIALLLAADSCSDGDELFCQSSTAFTPVTAFQPPLEGGSTLDRRLHSVR